MSITRGNWGDAPGEHRGLGSSEVHYIDQVAIGVGNYRQSGARQRASARQ